jgi:hypothetical protein
MTNDEIRARLLLIARDRLAGTPGAFSHFQNTLSDTFQGQALLAAAIGGISEIEKIAVAMGNPEAVAHIDSHLTRCIDHWGKHNPIPQPGVAPQKQLPAAKRISSNITASSQEIIDAFKLPESKWQDKLRHIDSSAKAYLPALAVRGARGKTAARWYPAIFANCLIENEGMNRVALRAILARVWPDCIPDFDEEMGNFWDT